METSILLRRPAVECDEAPDIVLYQTNGQIK